MFCLSTQSCPLGQHRNQRGIFVVSKYAVFALIPSLSVASLCWGQQPDSPQPVAEAHQDLVTRTMNRLIQNEIRDLPADHTAPFSASREVSIELEVPSTGDLSGMENCARDGHPP